MILLAHLWQSTLCAALAALLAASLPHASGRVRHRIWLLASVKFLVPFSVLVSIGRAAGVWLPPEASPSASIAVRWLDLSQPFWSLGALQLSSGDGVGFDGSRVLAIGLFLWACGAAAIAWWRWRAWRALNVIARSATPLERGREVDALRRAARHWPRPGRVVLLLCDIKVGPGVHGVRRAQLLWPAGLSDTLSDAELDAIMAHEMCHVHRRDNAVALMQTIVETLFWFHPVVWWLGARLVDERERACDEEVLRMGADNRSYAEGIVKVCGFCLSAPVECAVGIGRSGLAQRIVRIMQHRPAPRLATSARAILATVGVLLVAAPLATGLLDARRRPVEDSEASVGLLPSTASQAAPRAGGPQTVYRPSRDVTSPKLLEEARPGYTAEAMRAGIQGGIVMEAVVLPDGTVGKVTVTRSLDSVYGLDAEAVKTVKRWRFKPGSRNGKAVPVSVEIEMTFTLK